MTNHRHRTHTQQPDAPQVHESRDVTPLIMFTAIILLVGVVGIGAALFKRRRAKRKKVLVSLGGGGHPQEAAVFSPTELKLTEKPQPKLQPFAPRRPQRPLNRRERRAIAALNRKK